MFTEKPLPKFKADCLIFRSKNKIFFCLKDPHKIKENYYETKITDCIAKFLKLLPFYTDSQQPCTGHRVYNSPDV